MAEPGRVVLRSNGIAQSGWCPVCRSGRPPHPRGGPCGRRDNPGSRSAGLLIYRQLRTRPVNASGLRVIAVLAVVGVVETSQFLQHNHAGSVTYAAIGGSLLLAAMFGALRAATVRLWLQDAQPWSRGTLLTAALWIVALAAHLGYDALVAHGHSDRGLGAATVVLYLAVSLAIQRLIMQARARRLPAGRAIPPVRWAG